MLIAIDDAYLDQLAEEEDKRRHEREDKARRERERKSGGIRRWFGRGK